MDLKTKNEEDVSEEENDNSLPNSQSNSIPTNYKANVTETTGTFKTKSVAEEVSEILTNLPETAKKFDSMSSEQNWTSLRLKTKENVDSAECRNIPVSPADSLCSLDNDDDDEEEAESSDMDEQTSSIHRGQCMDELSLIEKQFFELRDLLHKERHAQIVKKLSEVESETAPEYLQQLKVLQQQKEVKLQRTKVTLTMVQTWKEEISTQTKLPVRSFGNLIRAFQAAIDNMNNNSGTNDTKKKKGKNKKHSKDSTSNCKFIVKEASVINEIISSCLECIPVALMKHLGNKSDQKKSNKKYVPSNSPQWKSVSKHINLYLVNAVRFLDLLLEASVLKVFLRHLLVLSDYVICFSKILKSTMKVVIRLWSTNDHEAVRVLSFFFITRLIKLRKKLLPSFLQKCYVSYVSNCKFTTPSLLPMINFMQQTFMEICSYDFALTYNYAFVYIRNLAIHLRNASLTPTKELKAKVYNWQFVHSVSLWCRVLSTLHPNPTLHYPLIQVALGTIDLDKSKRFFPLRFRLLENVITLATAVDNYVPLLSYIIESLEVEVMKKKPKEQYRKPAPIDVMLKFSAAQLSSRMFVDTTCDKVYELLMGYINSQAHTIAFPEMMVAAVVAMKRQVKTSSNIALNKMVGRIIKLIKENEAFIKEKREQVTFQVTDIEAVQTWERQIRDGGVPFHEHYKEYRLKRERELQEQIADANVVVTDRLPAVDRLKRKYQDDDKMEFKELFEGDEDFESSFKKTVDKSGTMKPRRSKPQDFMNELTFSDEEDAEEEEDVEEIVQKKPKLSKKRKRIPIKVGLAFKGKKDVVEDLHLSDIE